MMILLCSVLFILSTWFVISFCLYRIKRGNPYQIQANVYFKMVRLNMNNRVFFETLMRNKEVNIEGFDQVFVTNQTYKKLHPEPLSNMKLKNQTVKVTLNITPLLFGGNAIANIHDTIMLNEAPKIVK